MATDARGSEKLSVNYGKTEIPFLLNFKNRKTLAIHVYPDCSVVVDAPQNADLEKIKNKVTKRGKWIRKHQRRFERYPPELPARRYHSGEAFRYLGRQYTLKVERGILNEVKLYKGNFYVSTTRLTKAHIKELVDTWYRKKARQIFEERLGAALMQTRKIGVGYDSKIEVRAMKTRWGSCTKDKRITLNPELICAHKECIDYVIVHELCHLKQHDHSPKFYKLLSALMPDWEQRKDKLETTMERREL